MSYSECCDWSQCRLCGECLSQCPAVDMNIEEAKTTMQRLIEGEDTPRIFNECTLCFNCNNYCPVDGLRPHELIQQRMLEHRGKAPEYVRYFLNGMPAPVIWDDIYSGMTSEEQHILSKWSEIPSESNEVLWIGCVGKMSCYDIEHSTVLKDLPKFGPPDICCGELAYRMGGWQAYSDTIERALECLKQLEIDRMVCYCASCYNFFANILPNVYGKQLPFKLISLYQWLWEKVSQGRLELKHPLDFTAVVSHSCYVSELGPDFWEPLHNLYKASGMNMLSPKHNGYDGLSCGTMSMARRNNFISSFLSMYKEQRKKYREVKETDSPEMAVNCPGCYLMPRFTNNFHGVKIRFMAEELLQAYGDTLTQPIDRQFRIMRKQLMKRMPRLLCHKSETDFPRIPAEGPIYKLGAGN